jgi:hypothetical protein
MHSCYSSFGVKTEGYSNPNVNIGHEADYVSFDLCLDCGKLQGEFPISDEELKDGYYDDEEFDLFSIDMEEASLIKKANSLDEAISYFNDILKIGERKGIPIIHDVKNNKKYSLFSDVWKRFK